MRSEQMSVSERRRISAAPLLFRCIQIHSLQVGCCCLQWRTSADVKRFTRRCFQPCWIDCAVRRIWCKRCKGSKQYFHGECALHRLLPDVGWMNLTAVSRPPLSWSISIVLVVKLYFRKPFRKSWRITRPVFLDRKFFSLESGHKQRR